MKTNFQF